ncbi:hypothetical protein [Glutamicibacter endophyticus]|uniref:hypothetical protein n=1 Tax=Glutamicibacter endophyticus TaxID=1522174 RepID=UPI003AF1AE4C
MITARMTAGRRIAASIALTALAFGATGCGAINQQATTTNYAASDGSNITVAEAKARNILLVVNDESNEARLIGSVVNRSDSALSLSIAPEGLAPIRLNVPADTALKLEDDANEQLVSNLTKSPGEHIDVTLSVGGESVESSIPVVDGTLPEYRDFVPGGSDPHVRDHLTPSPKSEEAHH